MGRHGNAQREIQLLAEWLATLSTVWTWKTHVRVGAVPLVYQGKPLSPAQIRAFSVWNDWMDARVVTTHEVWCVEAKIVGVATAYGQALDYANQYPASQDAQWYRGKPVVPVVLCAFAKPLTRAFFSRYGVRTIVYTPSWAGSTLVNKVFPSEQAGTPL